MRFRVSFALALVLALVGLSATTATARPFFSSGFEHGLQGFNLAGVGDVDPTVTASSASSGRHSCRVTLNGDQERSELIVGGNGGRSFNNAIEFHEGDEGWFGFSFNVRRM